MKNIIHKKLLVRNKVLFNYNISINRIFVLKEGNKEVDIGTKHIYNLEILDEKSINNLVVKGYKKLIIL